MSPIGRLAINLPGPSCRRLTRSLSVPLSATRSPNACARRSPFSPRPRPILPGRNRGGTSLHPRLRRVASPSPPCAGAMKTSASFPSNSATALRRARQTAAGPPLERDCEESARQLVKQIASLQNWKTNRLQAFIVAGAFAASRDDLHSAREKSFSCLQQLGFENAFSGLPSEKQATGPANARRPAAALDFLFARDAALIAPPLITQGDLSEQGAVTFEMDLAARTGAPAPAAPAKATRPAAYPQNLVWAAGVLACCLALFVLARKLPRQPALRPASTSLLPLKAKSGARLAALGADQIILAPSSQYQAYLHVRHGRLRPDTIAELASMLGCRTRGGPPARGGVRRCHRQPQSVAQAEVGAAVGLGPGAIAGHATSRRPQGAGGGRNVSARIELQIQRRNQESEQRIDALLKDLVAAREENRELIRARIALAQAGLEKARLKAAPNPHEQ